MNKKFILIFVLLLSFSCSAKFKKKCIELFIPKENYSEFFYTQLRNELNRIAVKNNFSLEINQYNDLFNNKDRIYPEITIIEENDYSKIKKIYKMLKRNKVQVALVTDALTNTEFCDYLFNFDLYNLGYQLANNLYNYSSKERNVVILFLSKTNIKNKIFEGATSFLKEKNITIVTDYYKEKNNIDSKIDLIIKKYDDQIKGFIVDNDILGATIGKYIRKSGKDTKIKIASYNASIEGLCSLLRFETSFIADLDKFSLYTNAFSFLVSKLKSKNNEKIVYSHPGIIYSQANITENLAITKKFAIQDLLLNCKKE